MIVLVGLFVVAAHCARGQAPIDSTSASQDESSTNSELSVPVDGQLVAEIDALIARLGSPHYKEREAATLRLLEIGMAAFAQLSVAYQETDELEVRLRIERIVHEAYLNHHVYDRNGFLGISQSPVPIEHDNDNRIQENHVGIEVQRVIENTAAQRAQLRQGDVIIALDKEPVAAAGSQVITAFGESIRLRGPGARVILTLLREGRQLDVEVSLGTRPKEYYNTGQRVAYDMLVQARQQFLILWARHFRRPTATQWGHTEP